MPKVSGIFEQFQDIDLVPTDAIASWLHPSPNLYSVENYIANLIFYSQTIPTTMEDIDIELALLRELLKKNPKFFDSKTNKISIPQEFTVRFPDITKLVWAFVDAYRPKDVAKIVLTKKTYEVTLGTIVSPEFSSSNNGSFEFLINDGKQKSYEIKQGSLMIIPCLVTRCHINFKSSNAKILGKNDNLFEVLGGELGVVVDGRGLE